LSGNLYAQQRVDYVADLLEQVGIHRDRIRMINISAGMGAKFAELASEFAGTITALGPVGLRKKARGKEIPLADSPAKTKAGTTEAAKDSVVNDNSIACKVCEK
jgi:hypothetical protein